MKAFERIVLGLVAVEVAFLMLGADDPESQLYGYLNAGIATFLLISGFFILVTNAYRDLKERSKDD